MVSSKKVHCAYCQKKCSGSVLRYQDQYYHKQCFELLQSELAVAQQLSNSESERGARAQGSSEPIASASASTAAGAQFRQQPAPELQIEPLASDHLDYASNADYSDREATPTPSRQEYYRSRTSKTTTTTTSTSRQQRPLGEQVEPPEENVAGQRMTAVSYLGARGQTLDSRAGRPATPATSRSPTPTPNPIQLSPNKQKSATLPTHHSAGLHPPSNGFGQQQQQQQQQSLSQTQCAACKQKINDGQALIALDLHWHVWCFKCSHCKVPLHGEYVAKEGRAYCEKDYQKLFGITCVYCKRYITGKVLQAGEAHHFHPSCARCSKCGDPFVPGEEMYLQGEVTWHPRCGPGPTGAALSPGQINESANSTMTMADDSALESAQSRSQVSASIHQLT